MDYAARFKDYSIEDLFN